MKNLQINLSGRGKLESIWKFGVNTCHAPLWFRKDFRLHLETLRENCGFNYVRFHSVLNDDMDTVMPDGTFNFDKAIGVYRHIIELGMTPFVEISSMPSALASNDEYVCEYKFRSAPPKDWGRWGDMMRSFAQAVTDAFGEDEVKKWYFEVWNEPDIPFWCGTKEEYFKLYDITRSAIKSVCRSYRVGGPATSKTAWIADFCDHVSKPTEFDNQDGIRCDFVSSHAYPSDLAFLDGADGDVELLEADLLRELCAAARKVIDEKLGKEIPFIFGEWNSSAGPYAFNHDECNNAPFICKTMAELSDIVQASMYWNATDIYEESKFHYTPFHGGYGLLNVNDIPKSSFHAFRLLNQLSGERVACSFGSGSSKCHGALCAIDGSTLRVIVWNYIQPGQQGEDLTFKFSGIPQNAAFTGEFIRPGQGSAYETWLECGSPDYINRGFLDKLEAASVTAKEEFSAGDAIELQPGTAALFTFNI